jgi:hypothetical protein
MPLTHGASFTLIHSEEFFKYEIVEDWPEKRNNCSEAIVANNKNSSTAIELFMLFLFIQQQEGSVLFSNHESKNFRLAKRIYDFFSKLQPIAIFFEK